MYVYHAIKRKKDNPTHSSGKCIKYVDYDESEAAARDYLESKISNIPGVWRIYRSVNRRDLKKAKLEFAETLIKQLVTPDKVTDKKPETLWKDILMKPANKAERMFLVDIDSKHYHRVSLLQKSLKDITCHQVTPTPNGYHMIMEPFNPELIKDFMDYAEVKKDALVFVDLIEVKEHE